jgi:hypothetical protein
MRNAVQEGREREYRHQMSCDWKHQCRNATRAVAAVGGRRFENWRRGSIDLRPKPVRMGPCSLVEARRIQGGCPIDQPTVQAVQPGRPGATRLAQREGEAWTRGAGRATCKWPPSGGCSCYSRRVAPWRGSQACRHRRCCHHHYRHCCCRCSCRRASPSSRAGLSRHQSHLPVVAEAAAGAAAVVEGGSPPQKRRMTGACQSHWCLPGQPWLRPEEPSPW